MPDWLTTPWWTWDPRSAGVWDCVYRGFNMIEATVWVTLGGLVLARWVRNRNSRLEVVYAMTFIAFGLTDFAEAWRQSAMWYPASRLY